MRLLGQFFEPSGGGIHRQGDDCEEDAQNAPHDDFTDHIEWMRRMGETKQECSNFSFLFQLDQIGPVQLNYDLKVNIYEAKAKLSSQIERAMLGEAVVISKAGKPMSGCGLEIALRYACAALGDC